MRNKRMLVSLMAILAVLVLSLGASAMTGKELATQMGEELNPIRPAELQVNMMADEQPVLIDVRTPGEYAGGHIPGAINIDFGKLFFVIQDQVSMDEEFYVYCRSGARSMIAANLLVQMGYTNVRFVEGGFKAWVNSDHLVQTMHGQFKLESWAE